MSIESLLSIIWRRRRLFVGALIAGVTACVLVTYSLPQTYKATATMYVGLTPAATDGQVPYDTSVGEQLARTYSTLVANENVADAALPQLPFDITRDELLDSMSFAPVERTPLLEVSAEAREPERAQQLANTYAQTFVDRVEQQVEADVTQARVSLNEPASLPTAAVKPVPSLYIGLGTLLSLALALVATLLVERVDDRLRIDGDDELVLDHPVLARIPALKGRGEHASVELADALQLLKANIDFADERKAQVLLITSAAPGDGKSTLSVLLARAAAADGERVALLDADLRRPALSRALLDESNGGTATGLSSFLAAPTPLGAVIHPLLDGSLDLIPSGPLPPNPAALYASTRMDELIAGLRERYDRVVIDTTPAAVGPDASLLLSRSDGFVYVLDARNTKRSLAQSGLRQLEKGRGKLIGIVVNRVHRSRSARHGYMYSHTGTPPEALEALLAADIDVFEDASSPLRG